MTLISEKASRNICLVTPSKLRGIRFSAFEACRGTPSEDARDESEAAKSLSAGSPGTFRIPGAKSVNSPKFLYC